MKHIIELSDPVSFVVMAQHGQTQQVVLEAGIYLVHSFGGSQYVSEQVQNPQNYDNPGVAGSATLQGFVLTPYTPQRIRVCSRTVFNLEERYFSGVVSPVPVVFSRLRYEAVDAQ